MAKAPVQTRPSRDPGPPADPRMAHDLADEARRLEAAQFIADYAVELAYIARGARLDLLAYLLDMARLEALRTARRRRTSA